MSDQATQDNSNESKDLSDIDSIMDSTIDDLADYVPFEPFPLGSYKCQLSYEADTIGEKELPAIRITFTLLEVIEMVKPGSVAPEEGRKVSIVYIMVKKDGDPNAMGQGQLKEQILTPLKEVYGGDKISEILGAADGSSVICTFSIRRRKNKETGDIIHENQLKAMVVEE